MDRICVQVRVKVPGVSLIFVDDRAIFSVDAHPKVSEPGPGSWEPGVDVCVHDEGKDDNFHLCSSSHSAHIQH